MVEIFVFEPDLIFSSKFEGLSRLTGVNFKIFTVFEEFVQAIHGKTPQALIISLDSIQPEMMQRLTGKGCSVLGYYSHVNSASAKIASDLGVKFVVTRGALVSNLPTWIQRLLSPGD